MDIPVNPIAQENLSGEISNLPLSSEPQNYQPQGDLWNRKLATTIFVGLTLVFLLSVFYKPAPATPNGDYFSICGFKNLTGYPCPGCGLTHSFCELGKGNVQSALQWNWMGIPLFIFLIFVWLKAIFILIKRFDWALSLDKLATYLKPIRWLAIAFAVYGVGRIVYLLIEKSRG
ncbi:MAG: DUF2752 domain-containing protein [Acidobacteriota bacterium]